MKSQGLIGEACDGLNRFLDMSAEILVCMDLEKLLYQSSGFREAS